MDTKLLKDLANVQLVTCFVVYGFCFIDICVCTYWGSCCGEL